MVVRKVSKQGISGTCHILFLKLIRSLLVASFASPTGRRRYSSLWSVQANAKQLTFVDSAPMQRMRMTACTYDQHQSWNHA